MKISFLCILFFFAQNILGQGIDISDPVDNQILPLTFDVTGTHHCGEGKTPEYITLSGAPISCSPGQLNAGNFTGTCVCEAGPVSDFTLTGTLFCRINGTQNVQMHAVKWIYHLSCLNNTTPFCCFKPNAPLSQRYTWTNQYDCVNEGGWAEEAVGKCPQPGGS